ncbi:hypothetical protein D9M68_912490 [compost metagenome]
MPLVASSAPAAISTNRRGKRRSSKVNAVGSPAITSHQKRQIPVSPMPVPNSSKPLHSSTISHTKRFSGKRGWRLSPGTLALTAALGALRL